MSKVIVKESPINGLVVFAITNIAKGEVILAIDDSRVVTSGGCIAKRAQQVIRV